jgi:hypothetical protein
MNSVRVATEQPVGNRRQFGPLPGGGFMLDLRDDGVRIELRQVRRERHRLFAQVSVVCEWADAKTSPSFPRSLSCADLDLSSQPAREARGKYCASRAQSRPDDFDWVGVIDEACRLTLETDEAGTPAIVLDDAPAEGPPADFLVHGLAIPADSHSQIITDGGGLKSLILLLVLGEMAKSAIPVALLDWEWSAPRHLARKRRLFGDARLESLFYLRCRQSLVVEKDHIRRFCDEHGIRFLALDSIGAACDGKLADDDVARAYNRALDDLPPSLAAAHVPKNPTDATADLKAFGSAFFHNYARMTWSLRKQVGADDDVVTVMLSPHKQNDGARRKPVGLEFTFSAARIDVRNVDPAGVEGFAASLPITARMRALLRSGPMTQAALVDQLGAKPDTIKKAVQRNDDTFTRVLGMDGIHRIGLIERRAV